MAMKKSTSNQSKFQSVTTYIVFAFFLFTTSFSGIFGAPIPSLEAEARVESTYITSYGYDGNGNVTSRTTPNNETIKYTYDKLNRLTKITYPDLSEVSYVYDASGNKIEVTDPHGTKYCSYDKFNRLQSVQNLGMVPIYYDYDMTGNVAKITYPTGEEITYDYDNDNRLISVIDSTGTTTYQYDNQTNNIVKKTLSNGVYTNYAYDLAKRITDVVNNKSDATRISSYHYDYDENNNVIHIDETNSQGSKTADYTYDKLNRLIKAYYSDGTFEVYTYDRSGNRLTKATQDGTTNYEYDGDNRLLRAGNDNFFYDNSGNLVRKTTPEKSINYTYDYENRLVEYVDGTNIISFEYDGNGNRISKTVNGLKTKYINNELSPVTQVLLETTGNDRIINRYVYGFSRLNQISQSTSYYIYNKPARSVAALVDNSGDEINSYQYDSFGNILVENNTMGNTFKYIGEQYDEGIGLIYLRNRYYDPEIGRFITKDPFPGYVGNPQTKNPYPYVSNNAVNREDPLGLFVADAIALGSGAAAGLVGQGISDMIAGEMSSWESYVGSAIGGAVTGEILLHTGSLQLACSAGGAVSSASRQGLENLSSYVKTGSTTGFSVADVGGNAAQSALLSYIPGLKIPGITSGRNSFSATSKQIYTKLDRNLISTITGKTFGKITVAESTDGLYSNAIEGSCRRAVGYFSDFGGVSLSKTADLMLNINDIAGATYDEATGQVILFGKDNISLPQMDLDDLAVAVRSIYGYGGKEPQDPGVSIGTEPSDSLGEMRVRYDGQTYNTKFGGVMFEADRTLKNLMNGQDNMTKAVMSSGVPGYKSLPTRYREAGSAYLPREGSSTRMWIVPQKIILAKSDENETMIFNTVTMELLTESKVTGNVVTDVIAEQFADHFTQNYDKFAANSEFPILNDLKRLGKITAVVKWIRDSNIPFDLSFFENYTPEVCPTPQYTPEISIRESWSESHHYTNATITRKYTYPSTGGVSYCLDASNFSSFVDSAADRTKQDALAARPVETDFSWNFRSGGQSYEAVAYSMARSRKDGNIKRIEEDMSFPVEGGNPLSFIRFYNSFNDKSTGFGFGWDVLPYKLRFPADKQSFTFGDQSITADAHGQIYITEYGSEQLYTLYTLLEGVFPAYHCAGGQHILIDKMDGTYIFFMRNRGFISFDSQGRISSMVDNNGVSINYNYSGAKLSSISHQGGRVITLNYIGDTIASATGPGSKAIYYTYDGKGSLETVRNQLNEIVTYSYDTDRRLSKVVDPRGNTVFQAGFDDYNRASSQIIGSSAKYSSSFSMAERTSTITGPNDVTKTHYFDTDYRLTNMTDSLGRHMGITYDVNNFGPATVTDHNGNTTEYKYDVAGNIISIKDAENGEVKMAYDSQNNPIIVRDARGYDTAYVYDANNRLIEIFHDVTGIVDDNGMLTGKYNYNNISFVTIFTYDPANGNLLTTTSPDGKIKGWTFVNGNLIIKQSPDGKVKNTTYDDNGMPLTITQASGYRTNNTYDSRSRLTSVTNQGGEYVAYDYDAADRIRTIMTPASVITYTYDANGNVDIVYDGRYNPTVYGYDANNNLVRVTDAELGVTEYEYDTVNNVLTRIILPNGSVKEIEYDELNRPVREIFRGRECVVR